LSSSFQKFIFDQQGAAQGSPLPLLSCHPWESIEIDILFYGHYWGEPASHI